MSVKCAICQEEFTLIHWSHLARHGISTKEYRDRHGEDSLVCPEYKKLRSEQNTGDRNPNHGRYWSSEKRTELSKKLQGREPWNKNQKLTGDTLLAVQESVAKREARYQSGELVRYVQKPDTNTRQKISESVKQYAQNNLAEIRERASRSLATKKSRGYDLAFFRGKKHSADTKQIISQKSHEANKQKSESAYSLALERAALANLEVQSRDRHYFSLRCLICKTEFDRTRQYFTDSKFSQELCPVCYPRDTRSSKIEQEIYEYLLGLGVDFRRNSRCELPSKRELDLFLESQKLAIEVNGIYWHSELVLVNNGHSKLKDYLKYQECEKQGIRLITIYDVEWIEKRKIVQSRLAGFLGVNQRIHARKCELKEIDSKTANNFLRENHLQGSGRSNVRVGLYHDQILVSVMTFSKENLSRKTQDWEINRFAHALGLNVLGAASKMFQYFVTKYAASRVISYSDNRWGSGQVYEKLGMKKSHQTPPNYWYFKPNDTRLHHRFSLRKTHLDHALLTEWQNRQTQGFNRIWDLGNTKWIYER